MEQTAQFVNGAPDASTAESVAKIFLEPLLQISTPSNNTTSANYSADVFLEEQHHLLVKILKEHNLSAFQYFSKLAGIPRHSLPITTLPSTTTVWIPYTSGVVSWGFITPITIIGLFLLVVAFCLFYHNWRDKQRLRSYSPTMPTSDFERVGIASSKQDDVTRGSIRSNSSSRSMGSNTFGKGQVLPLPRKAPLRLARIEDSWKIAGQSRVLSPIDENNSKNSKATVTEINHRLSAYHMSWIAETSKEAEIRHNLDTQPIHVTENPLTNQLGNDEYYEDQLVQQTRQRSPYYPHNNTPTNEYDCGSECSTNLRGGDSAVSTNINENISLPSTIYQNTGRPPPSLTDGADLSSIQVYLDQTRPPSSRRDDFTFPSEPDSATTSFTESMSGTLSLPSSISRFHASRLNNTPIQPYPLASTHNGSVVKLNFTVTSSIDLSENNSQYSDNTSMFPNVGSSITSFGPSVPRSNPTSSCPSDIFSPEYVYGTAVRQTGTDPSTRQNSLSTNSSDIQLPPTVENSGASQVVEAHMFRNWSLSAGVNFRSLSNLHVLAQTPLPSSESYSNQNRDDSSQSKSDGHITATSYDLNHNLSPIDNRKVKFSVPVLNKKQYWI